MDEIRRLLRVTRDRNEAPNYVSRRFRITREMDTRLRQLTAEDGLSVNVLFEAIVRGFIERHPSVLAMIDEYRRRLEPEGSGKPTPKMSRRDLDEIYAAAGGVMMDED